MSAAKHRPGAKPLRRRVGVVDSFPKLGRKEILQPVFSLPQTVAVICRAGTMDDPLAQLSAHRFDSVLSDASASGNATFKVFKHPFGEPGTKDCAEKKLAGRRNRNFAKSLRDSLTLRPAENTVRRRTQEWRLREQRFQLRGVAECDALALLNGLAREGRAALPRPPRGRTRPWEATACTSSVKRKTAVWASTRWSADVGFLIPLQPRSRVRPGNSCRKTELRDQIKPAIRGRAPPAVADFGIEGSSDPQRGGLGSAAAVGQPGRDNKNDLRFAADGSLSLRNAAAAAARIRVPPFPPLANESARVRISTSPAPPQSTPA